MKCPGVKQLRQLSATEELKHENTSQRPWNMRKQLSKGEQKWTASVPRQ
jgi:hypothetical protein